MYVTIFCNGRFESDHLENNDLEIIDLTVESEESVIAKQMTIEDICKDVVDKYDKVIYLKTKVIFYMNF